MIKIVQKLNQLLTARERRGAIYLVILMLVMGLLETVGVASIMPFMAVMGNDKVIETNSFLAGLYKYFEFTNKQSFLIFLGSGAFVLLVISLAFKMGTIWLMLRYIQMRRHSLGIRLVQGYLKRPYQWFLNNHTSEMAMTVLSLVEQVIGGVLRPVLQFIAHFAVTISLLTFVIAVDPLVAAVAALILGGSYILLYVLVKKRLLSLGERQLDANSRRFQVTQESLGGIKNVKVLGLESRFLERFISPSLELSSTTMYIQAIGQVPHYALQGIAFGGILFLAVYLLITKGDLGVLLPLLALYAFAGYRLMPAFQQIYQSITALKSGYPSLEHLHKTLQEAKVLPEVVDDDRKLVLHLTKHLSLTSLNFTYPGADKKALENIDLNIAANTTIGFVGKTGSGKTTIIDIILGLLDAQSGEIRVDGTKIESHNLRQWQRNIGYVPQEIYLNDDTIANNIAFGLRSDEVDQEAVKRAAIIAELDKFVMSDLPDGYETMVGERGVRLSGGQRQRIGIARALYHDPDVLILDEATSALDNLTEKAVMDAVHNLSNRKTIILIAHRITTVKECDQIFIFDSGRIVESGTYEQLLDTSQAFRAMAT